MYTMSSGSASIFDLKAELTRKEEELSKTKTKRTDDSGGTDNVKLKKYGKNKTFQKVCCLFIYILYNFYRNFTHT